MSNLKLANELFLGKEELNHLKKSFKEEGYNLFFKNMINSYGIVKESPLFNSFKIIPGTNLGDISLKAGLAFDDSLNIIENKIDKIDILNILADSINRYIILKNDISIIEEGSISITSTGVVTGVGTLFTEMLRGGSNFPSKISFPNSALNTGEYNIASVTSDTICQLNVANGILAAENNLSYQIVGTFNPGSTPAPSDKFPFEKNYFQITLQTTDTSNGLNEFLLGSVLNDGTTLNIVDLRASNLFSIIGGNNSSLGDLNLNNPLVTLVKGMRAHTSDGSKDKIDIKFEWGFKTNTSGWSLDTNTNKIKITSGSGGLFSSKVDFNTGDFDGWYIYYKDTGLKIKIVQSIKLLPSNDIELSLENLSQINSGDGINLVPPGELFQIIYADNDNPFNNSNKYYTQSINEVEGYISIYNNSAVTVRYKVLGGGKESKIRSFHINASYKATNNTVVLFNGDEIVDLNYKNESITEEWTGLTSSTTITPPVLKYGGSGSPVASLNSPIPIEFRYKKIGTTVFVTAEFSIDETLTSPGHGETQMVMEGLPFTLSRLNFPLIGTCIASSGDERTDCNIGTTTPNSIQIQVAKYTLGVQEEFADATKRLRIAFTAEIDNV